MVGIGLGDEKDISLRGLEALKKSEHVFFESYTSKSNAFEGLERLVGKKFTLASRDLVEKEADKMLGLASDSVVSFVVVGDVFGATTHSDLFIRAKERNIEVKVINNASVINAVGNVGLDLYRFGRVASIVFDDGNWLPNTPYDVLKSNFERGLHTLCLLDIKTAEPSLENLKKGIDIPEPPRFMTVNQALKILLKLEEKNKGGVLCEDSLVVGIARLGQPSQLIIAGSIKELLSKDFGEPLHSLIIPGKLHDIEEKMLSYFKL